MAYDESRDYDPSPFSGADTMVRPPNYSEIPLEGLIEELESVESRLVTEYKSREELRRAINERMNKMHEHLAMRDDKYFHLLRGNAPSDEEVPMPARRY